MSDEKPKIRAESASTQTEKVAMEFAMKLIRGELSEDAILAQAKERGEQFCYDIAIELSEIAPALKYTGPYKQHALHMMKFWPYISGKPFGLDSQTEKEIVEAETKLWKLRDALTEIQF